MLFLSDLGYALDSLLEQILKENYVTCSGPFRRAKYGGCSVVGLTRQFVALKIVGSNPISHPTLLGCSLVVGQQTLTLPGQVRFLPSQPQKSRTNPHELDGLCGFSAFWGYACILQAFLLE